MNAWPRHAVSSSGGFTLIELLVVVVILGVLTAIVVGQVSKALNKARRAALVMYTASDVRGALRDYALEHDGCYPSGMLDPTTDLKADGYLASTISQKIAGLGVSLNVIYTTGPLLSTCPSAFAYRWCLLPPNTTGLEFPCIKVTESTFEEGTAMLGP